jgi:uncharacterized protein (TIGR02646 family)
MIKLTKSAEPPVLAANAVVWTSTLLTKLADGETPTASDRTHYRHVQIKAALVAETHGKCAYCESKLLHIHHGDVEHIFPKSLDELKTFDWSNLTLACEICNQNKSNRDPYLDHIIDPYITDPSNHITFAGALIMSKGTDPGTCTRVILDLNRGQLAEQRKEKLDGLLQIAEMIFRSDLPLPARQAMYDNLKNTDTAPYAAYSSMATTFVQQMAGYLPPGLNP